MVEYWKKKFTPGWDPVKDPVTVAQTEGMSHFKKAFEKYQGCLKAKGAWRDLMLETLTRASPLCDGQTPEVLYGSFHASRKDINT